MIEQSPGKRYIQQLSSAVAFGMNLISLDIRVLRSLLAVIESGSLTEAATARTHAAGHHASASAARGIDRQAAFQA
jgi:hypothetical protein